MIGGGGTIQPTAEVTHKKLHVVWGNENQVGESLPSDFVLYSRVLEENIES